jgi:sugar/nucleoside kinase (ribokinase family)
VLQHAPAIHRTGLTFDYPLFIFHYSPPFMKFLVVGHFAIDVIHRPDGKEDEQYGGIYNAIATLSSLSNGNDRILPVFGVHRDEHSAIVAALERLRNVDPAGVFPTDEPTHRIHTSAGADGSVTVCAQDIMKSIPFESLQKYFSVDGILVNMISGFDVSLETLDNLRMEIRGDKIPLLFDYHNLTRGLTAKHERYRRPLEDWRRWAFMVDIVQLNEEEIAGMTLEKLPEEQAVGHLLTLGVKGVAVTRGSNGATLFHSEHKHVHRSDIAGVPANPDAGVIGCGDVFGAAMLFRYVRSGDLIQSAEFANAVASARAAGKEYDQIATLREKKNSEL